MKLYATTTSERATKGQGGNDFIKIILQAGSKTRQEVGTILLKQAEDNNSYWLIINTKINHSQELLKAE